ncbi:MAG: ABC transporter ATP-binding protein [Chlorobi bacterium]|nr:ABC transporter ATP-binding protein [Chlorobiota bacterium]
MLEARNIHKSYGKLEVLKGIDLSVEKGEIVSIVGASGAGKSTLLHVLGTIEKADKGAVSIRNVDITSLNDKALSGFRNKNIGFVFQFHHLLPEFTALENICIPQYIAGKTRKEAEDKAFFLLDLLSLTDRAEHKPSELSGGEQQRVAIARALINEPAVVFADEPSGNLDSQNSQVLHKMFFDLRDKLGQTFIIATHNKELAGMADRRMIIKDGVINPENNKPV